MSSTDDINCWMCRNFLELNRDKSLQVKETRDRKGSYLPSFSQKHSEQVRNVAISSDIQFN